MTRVQKQCLVCRRVTPLNYCSDACLREALDKSAHATDARPTGHDVDGMPFWVEGPATGTRVSKYEQEFGTGVYVTITNSRGVRWACLVVLPLRGDTVIHEIEDGWLAGCRVEIRQLHQVVGVGGQSYPEDPT